MKKTLHMITVLMVLGLVAGLALASVYKYAQPRILSNQEKRMREAIGRVFLGQMDTFKEIDTEAGKIFKVLGKRDDIIGYAFMAEGNGYQGKISLMVGLKADLETISGIEVIESSETPGLGARIEEKDFIGQFMNLLAVPGITYIKGSGSSKEKEIEAVTGATMSAKQGEIEAITGATISSRTVVNILNEKIAVVRKVLLESDYE
ncbi:MAG: FMN-binding protein [Candidatus Omnitrophica bacterium]|nr:FMN-binding protein [Candidatus Omnitrophota bacterium]